MEATIEASSAESERWLDGFEDGVAEEWSAVI